MDEHAHFFIESSGVVFERLNEKGLFRVGLKCYTSPMFSSCVAQHR